MSGAKRGAWQRAPFTPGHLAAVSHGARSVRVYGALAEQLAAGLLDDRPDLGDFPEAVASWATSEAQAALLRRRLAEVGPLDEDGEPRKGLLHWLRIFEKAAAEARRPLGLDPLSEALVHRTRAEVATLAVDLEALAARGRAALAAREQPGEGQDLAGAVLEAQRSAYELEKAAAAEAWDEQGATA